VVAGLCVGLSTSMEAVNTRTDSTDRGGGGG
jgi:hypothetical protein